MSYTLLIGEYAYSDQSMRGWLALDAFGIKFKPNYVPLFSDEHSTKLKEYAPATSLPILLDDTSKGVPLSWGNAAIIEILAERYPDAGHWPNELEARSNAQVLAARALTGFAALQELPMNLHARYQGHKPSEAEQADIEELVTLLEWAIDRSGGPYLFGSDFCAADVAVAPIITRLVTYGFEYTGKVKNYVETLYAFPALRRWHACADAQLRRIEIWHKDLPSQSNRQWPRKPTLPAQPYEGDVADAINEFCPYSGLPISADSLGSIDGMIVGFCNPFCCRRGMADAESWPTVMSKMGRVPRETN
ncbi:MAG: glutathione S-transferase C-terminal domain-containing protein [Pseudomonadota bacterium]